MWSGAGWGWQVIPRIGQEVVVNFLDGDPDRPLVTGTVYNDAYKYPYSLPDNKTISGVKSDSTKGHNGFNEFYFEDKKGSEIVRLKAEKDRQTVVQNNETREIWNIQTEEIGKNAKESGVTRETTIVKGHDNLTIKHGDRNELLKMGDMSTKLEMGDHNEKLELGDYNLEVSKNINIKANIGISIVCGQSKITMTPASIKIESIMVTVDAQAMTEIKGAAMVTVKGGIVMIN